MIDWGDESAGRQVRMQIQERFFHRGLARGYEPALTDIVAVGDKGGGEAVQKWLQNHPHELPTSAPPPPVLLGWRFPEDFQHRLRAVLSRKTGRRIPEGTPVEISTRAAGSDDDSRGLETWIVLSAYCRSGRKGYVTYD